MIGTLHKTEDGWFVKYDGKTTPIEPNQNWWLGEQSGKQGFYKDGDEVVFSIETITTGTSEFDVLDIDVARISLREDLTIWDVTLLDGLDNL